MSMMHLMLGSAAAEPGKTPDEGGKRGVFPTAQESRNRQHSTAYTAYTANTADTHKHKHRGYLPTVRRPVIDFPMTMNHRPTIARPDPSTPWLRVKGLRKEGSTNGRKPCQAKA